MKFPVWRPYIFVMGLVAWPASVEAHSPIKGLGTFYNYMLHPLAVPAHAMVLIAMALMLGQQGREAARAGLLAFALGLLAGLAASGTGAITGVREPILLFCALVLAGAVSLALHLPILAAAAAASLAGLGLGFDSAPEPASFDGAILAYAGLITGVLGVAIIITGLTIGLVEQWRRVGVRIAGSWMVAASALGLAFALSGP